MFRIVLAVLWAMLVIYYVASADGPNRGAH